MSALERETALNLRAHGRRRATTGRVPRSKRCTSCRSTICCSARTPCTGSRSTRTPCRRRRCCRSRPGACPEDCAYCPQSIRFETGVDRHELMPLDEVREAAQRAKDAGATRFCMGASYRGPKDSQLEPILRMIEEVKALGLETCATLGLLRPGPGRTPRGRGPRLLQPQSRFLAGVLRQDHHDAHVRRSARDARASARGRRQGVLRRHSGHGRDARRSRRLAADARDHEPASRERADQRARARAGHAARRGRAARSVRIRAQHRRRARDDAAFARAPVGRAQRLHATSCRRCASSRARTRSSTARSC